MGRPAVRRHRDVRRRWCTVFIQGTIATGPQAGQSFTMQQPIYIGSNGGNYLDSKLEWMSGPFALIGQRPAHPDNHWCRSDFCVRIVNLANSYRNGSGLTIAYNDCSLSRGGLFDHQSTWRPPHSNHRGGFECDVRANGGDNSIPFDPGTRLWFENLVLIEVGPQPAWWHEDQNTGNEHYHIVG